MTKLQSRIHEAIAAAPNARLAFAEVMAMALYDPEGGFYGKGPRKLGRTGDFFTSVSVGPLFGQLLADFAIAHTDSGTVQVIEQGAHEGQLARDVLTALPETARYGIVEPSSAFETVQRERLASFGDRVRWLGGLDALDADSAGAVFLCNELPDAFPVHVVRWDGQQWRERFVISQEDGFGWQDGPPSSVALEAELARLPTDLPPGFTTEVHLEMLVWIRALAASPLAGPIVIADYGLDDAERLDPARSNGTLRRYFQQRMDDQVLHDLGECDLTSHVPFTRMIMDAETCGLTVQAYEDQGRWLTRVAAPWLRSLGGRPPDADARALLRQFQTLTHPQFMGRSFRILVLKRLSTSGPHSPSNQR